MKKKILVGLSIAMIMVSTTGCASWNRMTKSVSSDLSGGINRTITVYSLDGKEKIAEYSGKIDVKENDNKVSFDLNGKRTMIYNATVVVQEQ